MHHDLLDHAGLLGDHRLLAALPTNSALLERITADGAGLRCTGHGATFHVDMLLAQADLLSDRTLDHAACGKVRTFRLLHLTANGPAAVGFSVLPPFAGWLSMTLSTPAES